MVWSMRQFYEDVTNRFIEAIERNPYQQYYMLSITRLDDTFSFTKDGFVRRRAHLTIWNGGWTNKKTRKREIKEAVRQQVAAIDAERKK